MARAEDTERVTRIRYAVAAAHQYGIHTEGRIVRSRGKSVGGAQSTPQSIYCVTVHGTQDSVECGPRVKRVPRPRARTLRTPSSRLSTDISWKKRKEKKRKGKRYVLFSCFLFLRILIGFSSFRRYFGSSDSTRSASNDGKDKWPGFIDARNNGRDEIQ